MQWQHRKYPETSSTQDALKSILEDEPSFAEGLLISTQNQTAGRGRHGRTWEAAEGNLYFSFFVKPECDLQKIGQLALITGLALHQTISPFASKVLVKWPNDLMIENKKCAGILIETIDERHAIIGVGINIKNTPYETATCLQEHTDQEITANVTLSVFQSHFSKSYKTWKDNGFSEIRDKWLEVTYNPNQPISVKIGTTKIMGTFETIDMYGNLVLICDETKVRKTITSGDVFPIDEE